MNQPISKNMSQIGCVSLNGGTPISHPKMIIFSRKTLELLKGSVALLIVIATIAISRWVPWFWKGTWLFTKQNVFQTWPWTQEKKTCIHDENHKTWLAIHSSRFLLTRMISGDISSKNSHGSSLPLGGLSIHKRCKPTFTLFVHQNHSKLLHTTHSIKYSI